jgi:hypothetical protein
MYPNQRRARMRISDDSIMRDAMMETHDLRVSVLHAGVSRLCVSHVVILTPSINLNSSRD